EWKETGDAMSHWGAIIAREYGHVVRRRCPQCQPRGTRRTVGASSARPGRGDHDAGDRRCEPRLGLDAADRAHQPPLGPARPADESVPPGSAGRFTSRTLVLGGRDEVEYVIEALQPAGTGRHQIKSGPPCSTARRQNPTWAAIRAGLRQLTAVAQAAVDPQADTIIVAGRPDGNPDFVRQLGWQLEGSAVELVLATSLPTSRSLASPRPRRQAAADQSADPRLRGASMRQSPRSLVLFQTATRSQ